MKKVSYLAVVVFLTVGGIASAQTPSPPVYTKVTLTELHCMGCAKRIAKKVNAVPGVAQMRVDLKAKTLYVIHKPGMTPSPRAVWVAIEEEEHTPVRMETPKGVFTEKPKG